MKKTFATTLIAIALAFCTSGPKTPDAKPYKFDRKSLMKLVQNNKMLYDTVRRQGKLIETFYYLPDTGKIRLLYDERGLLNFIEKYNEHGQSVMQEYYHENGQRAALIPMAAFEDLGPSSLRHGFAEEFYDDGKIQSQSEYKRGQLLWKLEFSREGISSDTLIYEYIEPVPQKDTATPKKPAKPKVEKIGTATTPN